MKTSLSVLSLVSTLALISASSVFGQEAAPAKKEAPAAAASPAPSPVASPSPSASPSLAEQAETTTPTSDRIWKVGVYVAPVELPRLLSAGIEGRIWDTFGLSFQTSVFPMLSYQSISAKLTGSEIRPRWYPFKGAFFVSVGFGSFGVKGSKTETIQGESVEVIGDVSVSTISPSIGWTWGAKNRGFFYGMDIGIQLNSNTKTVVSSSTNSAAIIAAQQFIDLKGEVENKAKDAIDPFTKYPFPVLGLVKFGWMF